MTSLKSQIINAVATAALLGAGSALVGLKVNDSKQDQQIEQLQELHTDVKGLRTDLQSVDKKLERLDGIREGERERPAQ